MDHNHLKALLHLLVKLLTASYFFDKFLYDNSVIVISFTRGDLYMVHAAEHNTLNNGRASGTCFKFFMLALDFVHIVRLVQFVEQTFSKGSLATA